MAGRFAIAAVPPRLSASAISAPPCSTLLRLVSLLGHQHFRGHPVGRDMGDLHAHEMRRTAAARRGASRNCGTWWLVVHAVSLATIGAKSSGRGRATRAASLRGPRLGQAVAGAQHLVGHVGAGLAEQRGQQARALDRDQLVVACRRSAAPARRQVGQRPRIERQHGAQQDRAGEQARLLEQQRPGDVGAVGIAERDRLRELVAPRPRA